MATRAKQICLKCGALSDAPYCPEHADIPVERQREFDRKRSSNPLRKLYNTARWRNDTRLVVLARDPLCTDGRVCGKRAWSTVVDHIIAAVRWVAQHDGDLNSFFDEANLHGVCKPCHDAKREADEQRSDAVTVGGIKILR